MFYDISVMNGNNVGAVWRAGTHRDNDTSDVSLPKVCSYLYKRIENYENHGRQNFSLRTSSVLLNGAVRVYKELLDNLYNDCVRLDEDITLRLCRKISSHEVTSSKATSPEVSKNTSKRSNSLVQEANTSKRCRLSQNSSSASQLFATSIADESINNMSKSVSDSNSVVRESEKNQCDKGVETTKSFIKNLKLKEEYRKQNANFEKNSPVALTVVYENDSRLPKKIIFSNINKDIRKL